MKGFAAILVLMAIWLSGLIAFADRIAPAWEVAATPTTRARIAVEIKKVFNWYAFRGARQRLAPDEQTGQGKCSSR